MSDAGTGTQKVADQEGGRSAFSEQYFPSTEGGRWKWRATTTIGDRTGPLKPTVLEDSFESRIAGHEQIDGVQCLRIEKADRLGNVVQTECIAIRPDGHYRYRMNQDRFVPPIKVLALPAKVGTSWKGSYTVQGIRISLSSKIDAEESITVAAGTFKTIRVSVDAGLLKTTTWYAPGVGVVKQSVDKAIQSQRDDLELEEFTPGESPTTPK